MQDKSVQGELRRYRQGTFADVIYRNALIYPDREAFVCGPQRFTFSQYNGRVNRLVHGLRSLGMTKGEVVGIVSWNCVESVEAYGAAFKGGFVAAPFNARLQEDELAEVVNDSRAGILLVGAGCEELVERARPRLAHVRHYLSVTAESPDMLPYADWLAGHPAEEPGGTVEEDDPCLIIYTSGTTGTPKGALYTHRRKMHDTWIWALNLNVETVDRNLLVVPLFHIAGTIFLPFMHVGATTIMMPNRSFDGEATVRALQEERITFLHVVPTQLVPILAAVESGRYDLSNLSRILYAASPMPVELLRRGLQTFGPIFLQSYGQSEAGPNITFFHRYEHDVLDRPPAHQRVLASAGRPCLGVHVKIVDGEGRDVGEGETGEIMVSSKSIMQGYWRNPEETGKTIVDGWLRTGDMGYSDALGYLYLVDRKKDMIVSGGENVYPYEVEQVLCRHPAVQEAAVIGIPDPYWIEKVHAVVVLREGAAESADGLRLWCREHLASYKVPKSVEIIDVLPRTATGKILRRELRGRYAQPSA